MPFQSWDKEFQKEKEGKDKTYGICTRKLRFHTEQET